MLHSANRFEADNMEAFLEHHGCGLTEKQATHVDLNNLPRLAILLNAVASIVELCECSAELVKVVTEDVREQVLCDADKDLRKSYDALG